jgi:tryptophan synthase alpha chain
MTASSRIARRFAALKRDHRSGLVTFVTAGDPDLGTSMDIFRRLPAAGADIIELGMPFSDPMADGPTIQASSQRALKAGQTLSRTFGMVAAFRDVDRETPVILMGYYNPIYRYGVDRFVRDARAVGVDGLIVVDLPPEECEELLYPARAAGLDVIFLVAPTSDDARLPVILAYASGFVYYVSITGITGTTSAIYDDVARSITRIRSHTQLPVAVGFGIRTAEQAAAMAGCADAAVVGSALVAKVAEHLDGAGQAQAGLADAVLALVRSLAQGVREAGGRGGPS